MGWLGSPCLSSSSVIGHVHRIYTFNIVNSQARNMGKQIPLWHPDIDSIGNKAGSYLVLPSSGFGEPTYRFPYGCIPLHSHQQSHVECEGWGCVSSEFKPSILSMWEPMGLVPSTGTKKKKKNPITINDKQNNPLPKQQTFCHQQNRNKNNKKTKNKPLHPNFAISLVCHI